MPATLTLIEQLAEGITRGVIGGLADNADKLGALATGLADAWRRGWETRAVDAKPEPNEGAVQDEIRDAVDAGRVP